MKNAPRGDFILADARAQKKKTGSGNSEPHAREVEVVLHISAAQCSRGADSVTRSPPFPPG